MTSLLRLLFMAILLSPGVSLLAQATPDRFSDRRIIVKFRDHMPAAASSRTSATTGIASVDAIARRYSLQRVESAFPPAQNADEGLRMSLGMDRILVLSSDFPVDVPSAVREFSNNPAVEYAEPDCVGTGAGVRADSVLLTDTYFSRQWGFRNTRNPGADIKAINAWPIEKGDSSIIVGVLDSGLKWDHPDISARVWYNKKEIAGNGIDDDGNGYVDDIRGWNFAYNTNNVKDDYGHGTNTASIIGASSNNGTGYAGLDWACKIMPVKVLDSTDNGYYTWWSSGIYYATNNGARVINMSLVGLTYSATLETAASYAFQHRCLIAAAMGNTNDSTK